ncbi:hypothetical protein NUU61_002018 [Penicillium alfredii]|uniref:Ubiquitin-like protease family profile domain-containing protein n=1 Tax=Penicillium alfredii TaxID=1506179 RepID=A0A9W9KG88_9EURO|nr:uncharacterized protein NUU61_002018 [Penicillium alfredii]KAJ5104671.1 hypothetical protein NUU61_002018 [Penicillium alfredii]
MRRRSESQLSSPESTRQSAKSKNKGHAAKISEFRDVENHIKPVSPRRRTRRSSSTSLDQRFTESAAQQRRGQAPNVDLPPPKVNVKSDRHSRENVLDSVEITKVNETAGEAIRSQQSTGANETRRVSDRESPDELQGEATTQPLPKSLRAKHKNINRKVKGEVQQLSPSRKRSPADIEPTDFMGSPRQSPKRAKRNQKKADGRLMSVSSLRLGFCKKVALPGKNVSFRLGKDSIEVEDISGIGKTTTILARHIQHAIQGRDPSCKVRIQLSQTAEWRGDKLDIGFLSVRDKNQLMHMLQEAQIKIQSKEMAYMDKVFTLHERQWEKHDNQPKKPLLKDNAAEPVATPRVEAPATSASARKKVSAALQDDNNTSEPKSLPRKKDTQETSAPAGPDDTSRQVSDDRVPRDPPESKPEPAVEIPVKTSLSKPVPSARETRSAARRSTRLSELPADSDILNDDPQPSPLDHDAGRERWRKPLVYPWTGKKKAEVNLEDRDRLREGEFLNDNLIAFYIRFLQDHLERTNPEAARRVYFFNSYFFETLKNTPKGTRGINYAGVEKWTRSVDLFSYDYIVVPINENAHWYVAIICNLPNLDLGPATPAERAQVPPSDKEASNPLESEIQEILETPEPEPVPVHVPQGPAEATAQKISEISLSQPPGSPRDGKTHPSVDSMVLVGDGQTDQAAQEAPLQEDEWPEADECPKSSPMKFPNFPASKRSATTPQPARNSAKPRIITFDSLDQARAPTVRMLRDYITKEAATKREVEIDSSGIKGMRARQIPLQPNYSDCGLYLLAYVEKFVQHPDPFITKTLDKQMNVETDWPPLGSGLLRHRLRSFLDDLYEEQAGDKTDDQWIMADRQPVSFLLGPSLPAQDESVDDAQAAASPQPEDSTADVALGETAKDDRVEVQIKGTPPPK